MVNGALGAAGAARRPDLRDGGKWFLYQGLTSSAAARSSRPDPAFDRSLHHRAQAREAAIFAFGGLLTFFGFMHGEAIGFNVTPLVALAYLMLAGFLLLCSRLEATAARDESSMIDVSAQPAE